MGVKLKVFLEAMGADDYYMISVTTSEKNVYFGYAHELPSKLDNFLVQKVYIDWASECLGIYVI